MELRNIKRELKDRKKLKVRLKHKTLKGTHIALGVSGILKEAQEQIESLINQTSSGDIRNKLCDINIKVLQVIEKATK